MTEKSKELIDLLNFYKNNESSRDEHNHDEHNHSHTEHSHIENSHENLTDENKKKSVEFKVMSFAENRVKKSEYLMYNGYRYRREILDNDLINWEVERISCLGEQYQISVFYRIFDKVQTDILENKYNQLISLQ